ncbi:hypothetical protein A5782_19030 [Mycobacterium sp. 852002-40037_SCH5390672]|nr:hypothetical protein A5782_19030 [Mycobacterium sp. 852002-40037_SCH5390672]
MGRRDQPYTLFGLVAANQGILPVTVDPLTMRSTRTSNLSRIARHRKDGSIMRRMRAPGGR